MSIQKQCNFPSKELRAYRQELAMLADATPDDRLVPLMNLVMAIDSLRLDHEALDGCRCWYTPAELAFNDRHAERAAA